MFKDIFKRSLQNSTRLSIRKIVNESKKLNEDILDVLDDVAGNSSETSLGDQLDAQITPAEDNKVEELKIQQQIDKRNAQINGVLVKWVDILDKFTSFINDPSNTESIKYTIDSAAPGSVLEKIKSSEGRNLTKVATAVSALSQSLRAYITGGVEDVETEDVVDDVPAEETPVEDEVPAEETTTEETPAEDVDLEDMQ